MRNYKYKFRTNTLEDKDTIFQEDLSLLKDQTSKVTKMLISTN
jgi:hypothetical protein